MELSDVEKGTQGEHKQSKKFDFRHDFNNVTFLQREHSFRATMSSVPDGVLLWLEDKTTKQQWQNTFSDVAGCGPPGIPAEAIVVFMKRAFEIRAADDDEEEEDEEDNERVDEPHIDLAASDGGGLAFTLKLNLHGVWNPQFLFSLLPVGLKKTDILESKVKDLQEENQQLREAMLRPPAFLSLSSATACAKGELVCWDAPEPAPREVCDSHFTISDDNKLVTIRVDGLYQIQTTLVVHDTEHHGHHQTVCLKVNDVVVAGCTQRSSSSLYNSSQIFELLRMRAGDTLAVQCNANDMYQDKVGNRLTIVNL